ncbi:MAG TPA: hypothetical protein VLU23_15500 [Pseudolabrys sp.]|jgi:hypothetical protein|nr:hypothetical protein [Pseudolabrys sp.]
MTIVRPDWLDANKSGPEIFAPQNRRTPEKPGDAGHIAFLRRQRSEAELSNDPVMERPNELIRRVSGASIEEIDRVIRELESVREMLRTEGERVSREIVSYANLSNAATTAMKVIAESLHQWKETPLRP